MSRRFTVAILPLIAVVATAMATAQGPTARPRVTLSDGVLEGSTLDRGGAVFKGVPFAQPPVGPLRWREPQPPTTWQGVRDAVEFGPPCAQSGLLRAPADVGAISREDCLYLNVWVDEWPIRVRKPVMVWIPGGGNFGGTSNLPSSDGASLARHGVIVVTTNYRLSLMGFLAHRELTNESAYHASGNYGLLDQIAALRWVKRNISQFGGDPTNVTIFGESAGSFDVSFLLASPLARGLFHRAIAESGAVTTLGAARTLAIAERDGEQLVARLTPPGDHLVPALRALTQAEVFSIEPNYLASPPPSLFAVVDHHLLTEQPADTFATGREARVPMIIGSTSRERIPGSALPTDLAAVIRERYGDLAPRALDLYGVTAGSPIDQRYGSPANQWATDTSFRCSATLEGLLHAAAGNSTYQYEFDGVPNGREAVGATHASELPYVFGVLHRVPPPQGAQYETRDERLSEAMQRYWTNFAKTGDPNGPGLTRWPKLDARSRPYLAFTNDGPIAGEGLRRQFCDLYIEHIESLRHTTTRYPL